MTLTINRRTLLLGATALATASGLAQGITTVFAQQDAEARTNHALLIAVTDYPLLPPSAKLIGPNNDAQLVRDFLLSSAPINFKPENITVLADELENAIPPTRDAIRSELDNLAGRVSKGDFVFLQFSGHGTQQPAMDPTIEPDGLDEIFLPKDTGMWEDRSKGVPNALIDKEIRDHLQAIRNKGAFIWAVFDCCHSGTMTRAIGLVDSQEVERKINPADLGISDDVLAEAVALSDNASRSIGAPVSRQNALGLSNAEPTGADSLVSGGMVAFFAAQTTETTPEMPLPRGAEDATRLGLFTFTLFSKIAENPAVSYRQLGQAVLQSYSADNRTRPTPLFEGDLDRPIFGMTQMDRIAQWPIKAQGNALELPAGHLHRLSPGARLAILPSPGSALDDAIGFVEVKAAKNLSSRIAPVASNDQPAIAIADIPAGAYARLTDIVVGFELTVARPDATNNKFADEIGQVNEALDTIVSGNQVPVNLRFVGATDDADIKIAVMSEMDVGILVAEQRKQKDETDRAALSTEPRIWLLPATAELSLDEGHRAPSFALSDKFSENLADSLVRIFRATSLSQLGIASDFGSDEVSVNFKLVDAPTGSDSTLKVGEVPLVHPDDELHITANNSSKKAVDINVLYIGSDYSIGHMYAERLPSGAQIDVPLLAFNNSSYGIERMVVVLSDVAPQAPFEDLSFLEQIGVRQDMRTAGFSSASFSDLLRDVAGAPTSRGAARIGEKSGSKGAVMIFPLENTPRI